MNITLPLVRDVLRAGLGFNSFVATFIRSVTADKTVPTACIDAGGHLSYSPQFVKKHVKTKTDLFCLILHELMHPFFRHYVYGAGKLVNIACDAVINAAISQVFAEASGRGSLFRKLYRPTGIELLLRPDSYEQSHSSRYAHLYSNLYACGPGGNTTTCGLTTGGVIQTLEILADGVRVDHVLLVGSHDDGEGQGHGAGAADGREEGENDAPQPDPGSELPQPVLEALAKDIKDAMASSGGNGAGFGAALSSILLQVLRSHLTLKRRLLKDFLTTSVVGNFLHQRRIPARQTSPIPIAPGKRDLVLLAAGVYPMYFRNRTSRVTNRRRGLAVYLDVSGSVNSHLPQIVGILQHMRGEIETVFLFSNRVVEIPFRDLVERGQFERFVRSEGYKTDAEKEGKAYALKDNKWGYVEGASWRNPLFKQTDDHPVVCVSWNDSVAFCKWLAERSREPARLPSEAEWEYACRAGSTETWWWSEKEEDAQGRANIAGVGEDLNWSLPFKGVRDGFTYTAPVGSFKPNGFGLYDVIGNVWEWCSDWYGESYYGESPKEDPEGPRTGSHRVLRGGSWSHNPRYSRCASRGRGTPAIRDALVGFRVCVWARTP